MVGFQNEPLNPRERLVHRRILALLHLSVKFGQFGSTANPPYNLGFAEKCFLTCKSYYRMIVKVPMVTKALQSEAFILLE
jgi:hypothetical protein